MPSSSIEPVLRARIRALEDELLQRNGVIAEQLRRIAALEAGSAAAVEAARDEDAEQAARLRRQARERRRRRLAVSRWKQLHWPRDGDGAPRGGAAKEDRPARAD